MDASVKLKLLLPMYKSVLTKQDVVDLARNLAEEKILKQKDGKIKSRLVSAVAKYMLISAGGLGLDLRACQISNSLPPL